MNKSKCLEYYLDSKVNDYQSVQRSIDETKKEYIKKDVSVNIELNKYGMYIITFCIKDKNTFFNKIRLFFRRKNNPLLQEKSNNYENNRYGQYKETKKYRPY